MHKEHTEPENDIVEFRIQYTVQDPVFRLVSPLGRFSFYFILKYIISVLLTILCLVPRHCTVAVFCYSVDGDEKPRTKVYDCI